MPPRAELLAHNPSRFAAQYLNFGAGAGIAAGITQILPANAASKLPEGIAMEPGEKIDLNTATMKHLTELPGIAVNVARRILAYRKRHGGIIHEWDELLNVNGFPADRMQEIKARATLGLPPSQRKPPQREVLHHFPGQHAERHRHK